MTVELAHENNIVPIIVAMTKLEKSTHKASHKGKKMVDKDAKRKDSPLWFLGL